MKNFEFFINDKKIQNEGTKSIERDRELVVTTLMKYGSMTFIVDGLTKEYYNEKEALVAMNTKDSNKQVCKGASWIYNEIKASHVIKFKDYLKKLLGKDEALSEVGIYAFLDTDCKDTTTFTYNITFYYPSSSKDIKKILENVFISDVNLNEKFIIDNGLLYNGILSELDERRVEDSLYGNSEEFLEGKDKEYTFIHKNFLTKKSTIDLL